MSKSKKQNENPAVEQDAVGGDEGKQAAEVVSEPAATGKPEPEAADELAAAGTQVVAPDGGLSDLARQVEALLLASDEPLTPSKIAALTAGTRKQIREAIDGLNAVYERGGHSFRVEQIADGYQMLTLGEFNELLEQLLAVRKDSRLSQAALEALAVVAYKQPTTRADVEVVRGVNCGEILRTLMEKRLVKIVGRAEILGRPMLYGTTRRFLELFGLRSIQDLPKSDLLKDPDKKDRRPAEAWERKDSATPPAESAPPAEPTPPVETTATTDSTEAVSDQQSAVSQTDPAES